MGCSFTDHRRRSEPFCFVSFWHREGPSRNDLGPLRTNKQASKGPKLSGQDEEMNVFIACILVHRRLGDRCVGGSCAGGLFKNTPNLCRGPNMLWRILLTSANPSSSSLSFPLCALCCFSRAISPPKPTLFLFPFCFLPPSLGLYCREECQVTDNLASNEVLHSLQRTIWLAPGRPH